MKTQDVRSPEDIANYVLACLNDFELGESDKVATVTDIINLITYLLGKGENVEIKESMFNTKIPRATNGNENRKKIKTKVNKMTKAEVKLDNISSAVLMSGFTGFSWFAETIVPGCFDTNWKPSYTQMQELRTSNRGGAL